MGAFNTPDYNIHNKHTPRHRSVLKGAVGHGGENRNADLALIARTLQATQLLKETSSPRDVHAEVMRAIRHIGKTLEATPADAPIQPGGPAERAFRRAVAQGRFVASTPVSHLPPTLRGTRDIIQLGAARAQSRQSKTIKRPSENADPDTLRAALPALSTRAFQTNRRLCDALAGGGDIPGLAFVIAETLGQDGKRGFVEVRDLMILLQKCLPVHAHRLADEVHPLLFAPAARRFRKLIRNEPPTEGDFDDRLS